MAQAKIGYAAMLEQFGPREVTDYSVIAEENGFDGVMAADHYQPWVPQQGQSAFVWSVMTAIGELTRGDVGPGVVHLYARVGHPLEVAREFPVVSRVGPSQHGQPGTGVGGHRESALGGDALAAAGDQQHVGAVQRAYRVDRPYR